MSTNFLWRHEESICSPPSPTIRAGIPRLPLRGHSRQGAPVSPSDGSSRSVHCVNVYLIVFLASGLSDARSIDLDFSGSGTGARACSGGKGSACVLSSIRLEEAKSAVRYGTPGIRARHRLPLPEVSNTLFEWCLERATTTDFRDPHYPAVTSTRLLPLYRPPGRSEALEADPGNKPEAVVPQTGNALIIEDPPNLAGQRQGRRLLNADKYIVVGVGSPRGNTRSAQSLASVPNPCLMILAKTTYVSGLERSGSAVKRVSTFVVVPIRNCAGLRSRLPGFSSRCDSARHTAYTADRSSTRQAADVRAIRWMLDVPRLAWWDGDGRTAGEEWSPDCLVFSHPSRPRKRTAFSGTVSHKRVTTQVRNLLELGVHTKSSMGHSCRLHETARDMSESENVLDDTASLGSQSHVCGMLSLTHLGWPMAGREDCRDGGKQGRQWCHPRATVHLQCAPTSWRTAKASRLRLSVVFVIHADSRRASLGQLITAGDPQVGAWNTPSGPVAGVEYTGGVRSSFPGIRECRI
ncbi:hypothetical protein L227DRAFT_601905, partial [Lentinus tigrinus ALCF2SS1-6]